MSIFTRAIPLAAAGGVAWAAMTAPTMAQDFEAAMEAQRCIWRCMESSSGADNPQYHACLAQYCNEDPAPASAPAARWSVVTIAGGSGRIALVQLEQASLRYQCQPGRQAVLTVTGTDGPTSGTAISVDGTRFRQSFVASDGGLSTRVGDGSPLLRALLSGNQAEVVSGGKRIGFPLAGSGRAIGTAMSQCRQ